MTGYARSLGTDRCTHSGEPLDLRHKSLSEFQSGRLDKFTGVLFDA
jgi:hypothetical protein